MSRDSSVSVETTLCHRVQTGSGAHSACYRMGTYGSYPRSKRPGREADHSTPSGAEVKNPWNCASTIPYVFMAWYLLKHELRLQSTMLS